MGRRAFTLLELILVMMMILVVAALASPLAFDALHGETKLVAAADMVRANWAECRTQAIEEGRPYAFSIVPNTGRFKVEPFQGLDQEMALLDQTAPNNGTGFFGLVIEGALPAGVRFGTQDAPVDAGTDEPAEGQYVPIAIFMADGSAQEDVEITFGAKHSASVTVRLRALTGAVTMIRSAPGEAK